jgi:phosphohistidine phosphatase SixA
MKLTWKDTVLAEGNSHHFANGALHFRKGLPSALFLRALCLFLLLGSGLATALADPPLLFVVRHAEKAATAGNDPDLSEAGRARAEALARILKDARITAIYATELKRTQQTAAPLAHALNLQTIIMPSADIAALAEKLKTQTGNALVIGHGNTIPNLLKALGLSDSISISENDYDNLFVIMPGDPPRLVRLHMP